MSQAILDFNMIVAHDRVMVCVSGGKDSLTLLHMLWRFKQRTSMPFDIIAFNLDQGQPGFPADVLPKHFTTLGVPFHIERQDTYTVVQKLIEPGKTQCSLCSRMRRGVIYRVAKALGATKIALGHHRDDIIATFFLNLFFASKLKAMPAKLRSDDGENIVVRPLAYVNESDCDAFAQEQKFPIIPCTLCGSQPNLQRAQIRQMMELWRKQYPGRLDNIFRAIADVKPESLLDPKLFDFMNLSTPNDQT